MYCCCQNESGTALYIGYDCEAGSKNHLTVRQSCSIILTFVDSLLTGFTCDVSGDGHALTDNRFTVHLENRQTAPWRRFDNKHSIKLVTRSLVNIINIRCTNVRNSPSSAVICGKFNRRHRKQWTGGRWTFHKVDDVAKHRFQKRCAAARCTTKWRNSTRCSDNDEKQNLITFFTLCQHQTEWSIKHTLLKQ